MSDTTIFNSVLNVFVNIVVWAKKFFTRKRKREREEVDDTERPNQRPRTTTTINDQNTELIVQSDNYENSQSFDQSGDYEFTESFDQLDGDDNDNHTLASMATHNTDSSNSSTANSGTASNHELTSQELRQLTKDKAEARSILRRRGITQYTPEELLEIVVEIRAERLKRKTIIENNSRNIKKDAAVLRLEMIGLLNPTEPEIESEVQNATG